MTDTAILFATGPCLITALGAIALFLVGASLDSGRHAFCWALACTASSIQWAVHAMVMVPAAVASASADILGLAAMTLYLQGFRLRRGRPPISRFFVGGTSLAAAALAAGMWLPPGTAASAALLPGLKGMLIAWALVELSGGGRALSLSEWAVAAMLAVVGLLYAAMALLPFVHIADEGLDWTARLVASAFLYGSASAAIALFSLLLIASDFSAERRRLVHTDPLTGVLNRLGFDCAVRAATRWRRRPFSMVMADIDRFKAINDRHGHAAGDAALAGFAKRIAQALRPEEVVGRIGGEEFALLLIDRADGALARVEQVRTALPRLAIAGWPGLRLAASFGIAERARGETLESLLARADDALYRSKRAGRDRSTLAEAG